MKHLKLFSLILAALSIFALYQNTTPHSSHRGGIAGIAPHPSGLMVWGWACKFGVTTPLDVNIYFAKTTSSHRILWKRITANIKNDKKVDVSKICGTKGSEHEFKIHIPYAEALEFNDFIVSAEAIDGNIKFSLPKYSNASNILKLNPELSYTKYGWVRGQLLNTPKASPITKPVVAFKGIPYATPPVGKNRWAASVPPAHWNDIKTTTSFGPPCMQEDEHYALLRTQVPRSEDCLYLNIWKPVHQKNLPVFVYIHGGQFKGGWSGLSDYDGAYMASKDIVFVSFNYRVGMMGFFTHPLFERIGRGNINFSLTDQESVLKWVKDNISEFGGDPNNVTLAGSSAGGASVGYWMTNKEAHGLFHKGIIESGGGSRTSWLDTRKITQQRGSQLTEELLQDSSVTELFPNCTKQNTTDTCIEDILFKLPIDRLQKTSFFNRYKKSDGSRFDPIRKRSGFEFHPVLDYKYVLGGTLDIFKCQQQKDLPLIVGSMGWEANLIENALAQSSNPSSIFEGIPESKIRSAYAFPKLGQTTLLAERFYGDKTFGVPAEMIARFHSQKNKSTYLYFFNYIGDNMEYTKGATHQLLTPFVFRSLETTNIAQHFKPSPIDRAVASVWSGYWKSFIKMDPSSFSSAPIASQTEHSPSPWESYSSEIRNRLFINHSGKLLAPSKREFGGRQTYNLNLEGTLMNRYQLIESYYFPESKFSACK